jgi:hypothetical protein
MSDIDLGTNLDNVEEGKSSDILPKGDYLVEVTGARLSEKDGSSAIVVEFTVRGDTQGGRFGGSQFVEFMSTKETALWKIKGLIKAVLGQVPKGLTKFPTEQIVGKRLCVYTTLEEYKGRDQTRVQQFKPASRWVGGKAEPGNSAGKAAGSDDVQV